MCACVSVCVAVQLSESSGFTLWEYLMTTRPGIGWVKGTASVTGVVLQLIICLMVLCSSTFVRRSGHFEVGLFFFFFTLEYIAHLLLPTLKMTSQTSTVLLTNGSLLCLRSATAEMK